jgi:hypothetical protein
MSRYLESKEQTSFFRLTGYRRHLGVSLRSLVFAVPNAGTAGGHRAMLAGVRRKAEGVTAGVPDIECFVAMPPFTGLHIEMKRKRSDGGKDSDVKQEQKDMMAQMTNCGRKCVVAFGCMEAWVALCEYLQLKV